MMNQNKIQNFLIGWAFIATVLFIFSILISNVRIANIRVEESIDKLRIIQSIKESAIKCGAGEYNSITGEFQWVTNRIKINQ